MPLIKDLGIRAKRILLPRRLQSVLRPHKDAQIVQIGSNDGRTGDPIHLLIQQNQGWKALFVEPVPYLFDRLRANYGNADRFRFANVAIGTEEGRADFYYVDSAIRLAHPNVPEWVEQLGSFDRPYVARHFPEVVGPYLRTLPVQQIPLSLLWERYDIHRIDFLHIDTEGFDWEILRQFDFGRFSPRAVLFEHKHLSDADRTSAVDLLRRSGYRVEWWGGDCLARGPAASRERAGTSAGPC